MIEEPHLLKKTVGWDLTRGSSDWSVVSGKLWRVDVRVESSP